MPGQFLERIQKMRARFFLLEKINISSPADAIRAGIGYLPEDRKLAGLALEMLLTENITFANTGEISNSLGIISNKKKSRWPNIM